MGNFGPLGTTGCDPDDPDDIPGTCGAGALTIVPSYANQDPTNNIDIERTNTFIGIKGDITETWTYDAYIGHSWSDGSYEQDNYLQGQTDASLDAELDGGGNLVCSAASLVLYPDCIAGDLFTEDALLRGILPADYMDFISKRTIGNTVYESDQFSGYVTGRLFDMPAGEVQAVFGYEWREESINDVPDQEAQDDNLWGRTSSGITKGKDTVNEFFTEIEIPLFQDAALAQELTINASWRYTDYDSYGGDDTYRIGLNWQVSDLLLLRGTTGTSFRAPDLFEQFLANETGFANARGNDVCIDYGLNYDPGTNIYDNCAADGLAPDFPGTGGVPSIRTVTGGNPNLLAETSDSWTAGFILTPEWVGASVAINWFDIEIENTVQSPTPGFVLFDCYNSPNKSSGFCSRIAPRDNMGFLTDVDSSLLNVGLQRSKGLDIDILYEREFSTFDMTIDISATHTEKQGQVVFDVASDYKGKWGYPDWVAQADFRIDYRDWTFFWNVDWIGSQDEDGPASRVCKTGTKTYNGASVRYRGQADWEVIGSVRNIFEKTPPLISDGCGSQTAARVFNTLPGVGYALFGRTYVLQLSKGFNF